MKLCHHGREIEVVSCLECLEESERTEADLVAAQKRIKELEIALMPFAVYATHRDAQPLRGMGDVVHAIHTGTPHAAEITMGHVREARRLLLD